VAKNNKLFAILRHKKIGLRGGQWHQVSAANRHNCRIGPQTKNVDAARTPFNRILVGSKDLTGDIKKVLKKFGVKPKRHDAVVLRERVVSASKEFFGDDWKDHLKDPVWRGKLSDWIAANVDYFEDKYGDKLVQVVLHLDEETPHMHILTVPIVEKDNTFILSAKAEVPDKKVLKELQTEYAEKMKPFGLARGEPVEYTDAKHEHHSAFKRRKELEAEIIEARTKQDAADQRARELESKNANLEQEAIFLRSKVVKQDKAMADVNTYIKNEIEKGRAGFNQQVESLKQQYETELDSIMLTGQRQVQLLNVVQPLPTPTPAQPTPPGTSTDFGM
jgi:flagellar biosynthesis GTPase FlhF